MYLPLEDKPLGDGLFREVYKIKGQPLVAKFPLYSIEDEDSAHARDAKMHTTMEVRKITKLSKTRWMRKYLPKIYYHDRKSGIVVMHYHPPFRESEESYTALGRLVTELLKRQFGVTIGDIWEPNIGRRDPASGYNPLAVLIDAGY
jgi:hypothetical protein